MQVKTDISLIYYISTTNSNRKINKKEINKIDIEKTLVTILDQSYALRLYSFMLRGVSKIYLIKMKYYETEVSGLLNMLQYKIRKKAVVKKKALDFSSDDDEDIYDGGLCTDIEEVIHTEVFYDNVPYEIKNEIFDDVIELKEDRLVKLSKKRKLSNNSEIDQFLSINDYPIFKLINIDTNQNIRCTADSLEILRNRTSSNILSSIPDDRENDNLTFDPSFSDFILSQHSILEYLDVEDNFNELCVGSRLIRAVGFYELLELLSKGIIEASQENFNSDIFIKRLNK
ncbi:hypothetical protein P3W45_001621 [Vairimorpha bombi]